jgi:hypothetical protein
LTFLDGNRMVGRVIEGQGHGPHQGIIKKRKYRVFAR